MKPLTLFAAALAVSLGLAPIGARAETLQVVTTVPDLADLVSQVGGDAVDPFSLVKGPQDPHFIEPRPSFIRRLHRADLFVQVGLELEIGWSPILLQSARNPRIQPGAAGHLDASRAIVPLEVPTAATDRSMGDVHPYGNPHYLLDPLNGLRVARLIRDRLQQLDPERSAEFGSRYDEFARRLLGQLVGSELVARHGASAVAAAAEDGRLEQLVGRPDAPPLGGWLASLRGARGIRAVQDHRIFPYFARRFGIELVMELEPLPGIAPTTAQLARVVERVRREKIPLLLTSPYFDKRYARRVADETGARVVVLAHQVGALPGTGDYLSMIDANVRQAREAL